MSKGYNTEREAKDNQQPGYYALLDVDCMQWFNYSQKWGYQEDGIKVTDNDGIGYTIEAAARMCIYKGCGVDETFNSATQEHREDISREMAYLLNEV